MNAAMKKFSLPFLHWAVGLVVLWESWLTFHSTLGKLHNSAHPAPLARGRLVISAAEIVAAILFLIPWTEKIGSRVLLVIFALAILIHALHGDFGGLGVLFVYAGAVWVCLAYRTSRPNNIF